MSNQNSVVGIYKTHFEAEAAIKEIQKSGFDMKKLSMVGATITQMSMWSATTMSATG